MVPYCLSLVYDFSAIWSQMSNESEATSAVLEMVVPPVPKRVAVFEA